MNNIITAIGELLFLVALFALFFLAFHMLTP